MISAQFYIGKIQLGECTRSIRDRITDSKYSISPLCRNSFQIFHPIFQINILFNQQKVKAEFRQTLEIVN